MFRLYLSMKKQESVELISQDIPSRYHNTERKDGPIRVTSRGNKREVNVETTKRETRRKTVRRNIVEGGEEEGRLSDIPRGHPGV